MTYSNGTTASPGDIIAVDISGYTYPFVVVALAPANFPNSGSTGGHPELYLAAVPFEALKQVNVQASAVKLWSDYTSAAPVAPPAY